MSLEEDVRRVVAEGERTLPGDGRRAAYKEALAPQYRLLLNVLSRPQPTSVTRVDDYLRVLGAIREPETLAQLPEGSAEGPVTLERLLASPLRVLGSRLARLPRTTVLAIEPGVDILTICTVRSGPEPLDRRIALNRAPAEFVNAAVKLISRHRDDIERIARQEPLDDPLFDGLKEIGDAAWRALPENIRSSIDQADTILYLSSAYGQMSELPIELWWTGREWLGTTRTIAHFPSPRTLVETLSPNRIPAKLDPRALIVRTDDGTELTHAAREVTDVAAALEAMALAVTREQRPGIGKVRRAFDEGLRALHLVGHGMAGALGEALPIGAKDTLQPSDFSQLGGARTPFAFLNVCELGRARVGKAGGPAGFATRLVEKGAPAVVACLQEVPDRVATDIAIAFYRIASQGSVGPALTRARAAMDAIPYPPSCWGAYVLCGDPLFVLAGQSSSVRQARDWTLGWPDYLTRFLVTRSLDAQRSALDLLALAKQHADQDESILLGFAQNWIAAAFQRAGSGAYDERRALCQQLAIVDTAAAASLRMLLAMECLEGLHSPALASLPEASAGLLAAAAVHDTIAWPAFAAWMVRDAVPGSWTLETKALADEAEGMLEAWVLSEPAVGPALEEIRKWRRVVIS